MLRLVFIEIVISFVCGAGSLALGFWLGQKSVKIKSDILNKDTIIPTVMSTIWKDKKKPEVKVWKIDEQERARTERIEEEAEENKLPH